MGAGCRLSGGESYPALENRYSPRRKDGKLPGENQASDNTSIWNESPHHRSLAVSMLQWLLVSELLWDFEGCERVTWREPGSMGEIESDVCLEGGGGNDRTRIIFGRDKEFTTVQRKSQKILFEFGITNPGVPHGFIKEYAMRGFFNSFQ